MFVEIRRIDESGQGASFGAIGSKQNDLAVTAFHVGNEDRSDPVPSHRLAENQVAFGEVNPQVLFDQLQIADTVALLRVKTVFPEGASDIGGGSRRKGHLDGKGKREKPPHI